ncbi:IS30 family transposase [Acidiferrimicrobium sp. IK]|nr:IS30 family transposase [Acidiferrimicrobium sp. IK]MCU4183047.1 IS30 family transposase [Acidiferrimicrobium sp. IK]
MPADPLTLPEREEIRAGIERGETVTSIAARLGRHRCSVSSEVSRNGGRGCYRAVNAETRARRQRARPKKTAFAGDVALAAHVTARLRAKDSPMTIAVELAKGVYPEVTGRVSHETIYAAVHAQGRRGLVKGLHVGLHRHRRCRKHRIPKGEAPQPKSPLGQFTPISSRPAQADGRTHVGHLEGDLIIGAANRSAIVTVFDRASRHCWLADLPDGHKAEATLAALVELVERIPPQHRLTLTWDQGREMSRWADLQKLCDIDVYFADAHHPWQRPTNENGNGLLRRYVGKGTDLSIYTPAHLRAIEHRLNTMPRRSLKWSTAHHVYTAAVAMTG